MHYLEVLNQRRSSEHVKLLNESYLEFAIFGLFKIDLINFINIKATLAKEFHIQPSELDLMPAWEYELFIKEINRIVKEENKKNEQDMQGYNIDDIKKMSNYNDIKKMQKSSIAKTPNFNNIKIPKL